MGSEVEPDGTISAFLDMRKGYELRSKLSYITNELKLHEKVSVIFLLCKTAREGLQIMQLILQEEDFRKRNNLFYNWMRKQQVFLRSDWCLVLAEVLAILQNYRVVKIFGFSKEESKAKFFPQNNRKSFNVCSIRKTLFNMSEELTHDQFSQVIAKIGDSTANCLNNKLQYYEEFYLLEWSEKEIINLEEGDKELNLSALVNCLNLLELKSLAVDIEVAVEKIKSRGVRSKFYSQAEGSVLDYYPMVNNNNNLGLCVIISVINFHNSLLPKRWGNEKDVQRLIEVFTAFGFKIKVHSDLNHEQFMNILIYYARTIEDNVSCFVLIILSHGSENVIYTSDSEMIEMNTIEMMFQAEMCPNLIEKPKIIMVQSCQGEKWQKVLVRDSEPEIASDNFVLENRKSVVAGPQRGDSMIAWSTVQGFASFRNKYKGSWYVEEVCNELWKYGDALDLVEIFTRVNNNLRHKLYDGQFMVPSLLLSLRAKIKFPLIKENFMKGKKLMLERLIFEKVFKEFLLSKKSDELGQFIKVLVKN